MSNTSATGGYIQPFQPVGSDQEFRRFLQQVLVNVSQLPDEMVLQAWQANVNLVNQINQDWLSFGILSRTPDATPYFSMGTQEEGLNYQRYESIDIGCFFYGPNCQSYAALVRDNLTIPQNTDILGFGGIGITNFSETRHVPELYNDHWFDRADLTITVMREIRRTYPTLSFTQSGGTLYVNSATTTQTVDWSATAGE